MEEIRLSSGLVDLSNTRKLERTDVLVKKDPGIDGMFEGKNIHSSPIDGKLLCSYSEKLCKQRRLNGYAFCIRHVLEDKNAPFKQCQYVAKYNGQQCTNPIPFPEDRIYCNSHLQVLGLVPKKTRRKKASESHDIVDKESTVNSMRDSQTRADVSAIHGSQDMPFVSPVILPHRHKKHKTRPPKKEPDIPAISELKACLQTSKRDREDLFSTYGIDSSDSDSSDNESIPWQQVWLHNETYLNGASSENECMTDNTKNNMESRNVKISRLSARLRRELHQLRRTLRAHRHHHPHLLSTATALLKAAQTDVPASVDSVVENSRIRSYPPACVVKKCAFVSEGVSCTQNAMPYTKFCSNQQDTEEESDNDLVLCDSDTSSQSEDIINDSVQVLYSQCTAKWPGGLQCSVPVFDIVHERALCEEHARKKDKFQEAQAAAAAESNKQQVKKPRKRPQPKTITINTAETKTTTKQAKKSSSSSNRKLSSRPNKSRTPKDLAKSSPLNSSFSPSSSTAVFSPSLDMQMSSDYSHASEQSPSSPKLEDLSQFESSLFEPQQQDHLLLPEMCDEDLSNNLSTLPNGVSPEEKLFQMDMKKNIPEKTSIWLPSSVPASVITATESNKNESLLNANHLVVPMESTGEKSKTSLLNSRKKTNKVTKAKKVTKSKPLNSVEGGILSPTMVQHNTLSNGCKGMSNHMTLNDDPMFSSPQEILGGSEIKSHGNGLSSEQLTHSGMTMESVLSSPQKSWPAAVNLTNGNTYTSPLNSQNSLSRVASSPFSQTSLSSLSPHLSPHSSHSSVFTFDRTPHYQQSNILSPTLSPVSPSYLHSNSVKHSVYQQRDLDPSRSDDPFLTPVEDQLLLGSHFHQNSDSSLGDLRLR